MPIDKMTSCVFISYSHQDRSACVKLRQALSKQGIDVRVDENSINPGAVLTETIRSLINSSDVVVCLISSQSLRSLWVIWEIRNLIEETQRGQFIPAYLDDYFQRDELVGEVQQWVDERLEVLRSQIQKRLDNNQGLEDLSAIQSRLMTLRNDLPGVVRRLWDQCLIDLTDRNFSRGIGAI